MRFVPVFSLLIACGSQPIPSTTTPSTPDIGSLAVEVRAPAKALYDPVGVGIGGQELEIVMRNQGASAANVAGLVIELEARRHGVELPCAAQSPRREAQTIRPGSDAIFRRKIDCTMPLAGPYDIRVFGSWDGSPKRELGSFRIEVMDPAGRAPRAVVDRPGLLATVAGPPLVGPTSSYDATIVVVNESKAEQTLGTLEIVLKSKPEREELWCMGAPNEITAPSVLAPGRVFVTRARLHCLLTNVGTHRVSAFLTVRGSDKPTEVGSMMVRVSEDPIELHPILQ